MNALFTRAYCSLEAWGPLRPGVPPARGVCGVHTCCPPQALRIGMRCPQVTGEDREAQGLSTRPQSQGQRLDTRWGMLTQSHAPALWAGQGQRREALTESPRGHPRDALRLGPLLSHGGCSAHTGQGGPVPSPGSLCPVGGCVCVCAGPGQRSWAAGGEGSPQWPHCWAWSSGKAAGAEACRC